MSDRKRPHEEDLSEADRVLLDLYDRSRETIPWDASDDAILAAAGAAQAGDDLDEADRVLLELYDRSKEPIPWDESDDEILNFARRSVAANDDGTAPATIADEPEEDLGENVVRFPANRIFRRVFATPAAGWAIAASLMVGIFAGQGSTPYVNLGVGPDVRGLISENDRLAGEVSDAQGEITRLSQDYEQLNQEFTQLDEAFTELGIRFSEQGEQPGPQPPVDLTPRVSPEPTPAAPLAPGAGFGELGSVLDQFECSALSATIRPGSALVIEGHVANAADMNRLTASLQPFADLGTRVLNQAMVYDWPHCEAVELLEELTLANVAAAGSPSVRPFNHGLTYREGEAVVLEAISGGAGAGYLYVDFLTNDGTIVHLLSGQRVEPGDQVRLGESGLTFSVAPPFGTEMLMVIQSSEPLFAADRPQVEGAEAYLQALRGALSGRGPVLSGFTFVTTEP